MRAGAQQLCGNVREIGPKGKNSERMHTHANRPREHCHGPWPGAGVVLGFSFLVSVRVLECVCVVGTGVPFKLHMESTSHAVGTPGPDATSAHSLRTGALVCSSPDAGRYSQLPGFCYLKYLEEFSSIPFGP